MGFSVSKGLRGQLLALLTLSLGLFILIFTFFWHGESDSHDELLGLSKSALTELTRDQLSRHGDALTTQFADSIAQPLVAGNTAQIALIAKVTAQQPGVRYVIVYDSNSKILDTGNDTDQRGQLMVDPLADGVLAAGGRKMQWTGELLDIARPVQVSGIHLGGVRIGLVTDSPSPTQLKIFKSIEARLIGEDRWLSRWMIGMFILLLLAGGLAAVLLEWRILRPLRVLGQLMQEDRLAQLQVVPELSDRSDEIGELVRAFLRMRDGVLKHNREIRRMAYTDPLTGLPNRLAFRESLDDRLLTLHASSGELAILFVDLDDFKRVNDTLGHEAGDEVLSQLSVRLRMTMERFGAQAAEIARFGGDEFIVLYVANDIRTASSRLADALIAEVERPMLLNGQQVFLGVSIGITLFPFDASHVAQLLKNADIAMYQAKVAGKNCYRFYSRAMDQAVERAAQLENDLRGAWERGEMTVLYQPIHQLADGRVSGAEALLRWQHPHLGMVPPTVFIEVAEQCGLIESIGRNVLERACQDAASWPCSGDIKPYVSVNVSSRQLRNGELPDVVATALRHSGLTPQQLYLELTETTVLVDEKQASVLLSRMRAIGVKIWLDDFGTGFSGLSHLRRVPMDGVKIDRSFISDILRDPDDLALTTAIIAMAHSLGIMVVAEGVESEGQSTILRERGCDRGQGFWFGRPMTSEELARKLVA